MLSPLPPDFEPTRATLHVYALAVSTIARAHAEPHEKWWHVALSVSPVRWSTDPMPLPGGGRLVLRFDLDKHVLAVDTGDERSSSLPLDGGLTGTEFGDRLVAVVGELGLEGEYAREKYENDDARSYDRDKAAAFAGIIADVGGLFEAHGSSLEGSVGRVNLWPHGFDLAIEWYGTRVETYEEHGAMQEHASQINLGFYPGGRAYIYSNPWPFEAEALLDVDLPHDAEWHTDGWQGSTYHYDLLAGDPDGERKLAEYAQAVYKAAAPTLLAS